MVQKSHLLFPPLHLPHWRGGRGIRVHRGGLGGGQGTWACRGGLGGGLGHGGLLTWGLRNGPGLFGCRSLGVQGSGRVPFPMIWDILVGGRYSGCLCSGPQLIPSQKGEAVKGGPHPVVLPPHMAVEQLHSVAGDVGAPVAGPVRSPMRGRLVVEQLVQRLLLLPTATALLHPLYTTKNRQRLAQISCMQLQAKQI